MARNKINNLMVTVKMFDGWPYVDITIEPGYKVKGGEEELLKEIVAVMKKWGNTVKDETADGEASA